MKHLLASLALLAALAAPAQAGITQIVGSGTGGAVGTGNITGNATLAITTNVTIPAGSLIVLVTGVVGNSGTTSCTDNASTPNTYTLNWVGNTSNNRTAGYAYSYTGFNLPSGSTITCVFALTGGKSIIASAWAGADSAPFDSASPTFGRNTGTAVSIGPSGTLACPATSGNCELSVGLLATTSWSGITEDSNFTSLGSDNTNLLGLNAAFRLVATNSPVTYAPTLSSSGVWAGWMPSFKAATGGPTSGPSGLTLTGVTN
jgi:hypothetical protein